MKKWVMVFCIFAAPLSLFAQGIASSIKSLHSVLDQLYTDMMPLCSQLIGVGRGLAGFGAVWYIGSRVWKHIAAAEPVDFFPLFRPFVLGFCVLIFPSVIALINGVLQPTVTGTAAMVKGSNDAISHYLDLKQANVSSGSWDISLSSFSPSNWIREMLRDFLEVIFEAASLCINTIRTFYLIVLAILGPFVFGLSIFDGFQHTVTVWLARYINIFLWLPVANIFGAIIGKIQENMILADASSGNPFSTTGTAYLVFLVISIVGYFTVPSVANYIVNAGGGNTLLYKVSSFTSSASKAAINTVSSGAGMAADAFGNGASRMSGNMSDNNVSNNYFKDKVGGK
jgi:hypothetical protein